MAGRCLGCAAEIVARCSSSSQSPEMTFEKSNSRSKLAKGGRKGLCKKHRRQGPIDDAFLELFLVIRPTRVLREM